MDDIIQRTIDHAQAERDVARAIVVDARRIRVQSQELVLRGSQRRIAHKARPRQATGQQAISDDFPPNRHRAHAWEGTGGLSTEMAYLILFAWNVSPLSR
jgi:hypothetical protein